MLGTGLPASSRSDAIGASGVVKRWPGVVASPLPSTTLVLFPCRTRRRFALAGAWIDSPDGAPAERSTISPLGALGSVLSWFAAAAQGNTCQSTPDSSAIAVAILSGTVAGRGYRRSWASPPGCVDGKT